MARELGWNLGLAARKSLLDERNWHTSGTAACQAYVVYHLQCAQVQRKGCRSALCQLHLESIRRVATSSSGLPPAAP
jgi:hypothetical protein